METIMDLVKWGKLLKENHICTMDLDEYFRYSDRCGGFAIETYDLKTGLRFDIDNIKNTIRIDRIASECTYVIIRLNFKEAENELIYKYDRVISDLVSNLNINEIPLKNKFTLNQII